MNEHQKKAMKNAYAPIGDGWVIKGISYCLSVGDVFNGSSELGWMASANGHGKKIHSSLVESMLEGVGDKTGQLEPFTNTTDTVFILRPCTPQEAEEVRRLVKLRSS